MSGDRPACRLVLVGGGHSHLFVLESFAEEPEPGLGLTLITRDVETPYSGMLPGLIAGHYGFDEAHIDTGPLARFAGARLYQDEAVDLDLAERRVICRHRPPVPYDLLSLNIGSTPNTADIPGASEHAIPVKPIDGFLSRFEALKSRTLARKGHTRVALVGAGAGGVELLLSVEHRLRREVAQAGFATAGLSFVLVTDTADILPHFPAAFRARFRAILKDVVVPDEGRLETLKAFGFVHPLAVASEGAELRFLTEQHVGLYVPERRAVVLRQRVPGEPAEASPERVVIHELVHALQDDHFPLSALRAAGTYDERLARLVQASSGFEQIERARIFLENFTDSPFRPSILLLFGDLMEEIALKMSADAARRLSRREMAASGAPHREYAL